MPETTAPTGPLTPLTLRKIGIIDGFPQESDFDPSKPDVNSYRMWSVTSLNPSGFTARETGMLQVARLPGYPGGEGALRFRHRILLEEGNGFDGYNEITVEAACAPDALSSPLRWSAESRFVRGGQTQSGLTLREECSCADGRLLRRVGQVDYAYPIEGALTSDWNLFDALQQPDFLPPSQPFTLLDGYNTLKTAQVLRTRPDLDEDFGGDTGRLRCITLLGRGILPTEFWLNEQGRVVSAISGTRVFFLDPAAEEHVTYRELNQHIYTTPGAWVPRSRKDA